MALELVLVARELQLYRAFVQAFAGLSDVQVVHGDIFSIPELDAVVSPANAFGLMDGGIDQVYVYVFGRQIETRVQSTIRSRYASGMPVGEAFVLETRSPDLPYLVVAPTMRVPGPIPGTRNPYLAMTALLRAVTAFNEHTSTPIRRLACPGLGTGTGRVGFQEAAMQMREAYDGWRTQT
jgi:O-acetyl-ADP-ribose deacetylase (regulator of RNase III)